MFEELTTFVDAIQAENDVKAIQTLMLDTLGEVLGADNVLLWQPVIYEGYVVASYQEVTVADVVVKMLSPLGDTLQHPDETLSVQMLSPKLSVLLRRAEPLNADEQTWMHAVVQVTSSRIEALRNNDSRYDVIRKIYHEFRPDLSDLSMAYNMLSSQITSSIPSDISNFIYRGKEELVYLQHQWSALKLVHQLLYSDRTPPSLISLRSIIGRIQVKLIKYPEVQAKLDVSHQNMGVPVRIHRIWFTTASIELLLALHKMGKRHGQLSANTTFRWAIRRNPIVPDQIEFTIQHTGITGPDAVVDAIKWFHVHNDYLVEHPTGGAYLLQRVLELHSGDLDVQIDEAAGVTVTIYLPLAHP